MGIPTWQKALAELIGTFALIFIGVLAVTAGDVAAAPEGTIALVTVAFAHGLIIAVMVAALAAVSGGHFNPAITLGFVVTGRMDVMTGAIYWLSQLVGAAVAAFLLAFVIGGDAVATGTPALAPTIPVGAGIVLEAVCTFFLVFVVFGTAVDERAPASVFPFAIGLTIALDIMAIGPLTGGAVNPARAFGPALASGAWDDQLVYWVGPLIGGAIAGWVMHYALMVRAPTRPTAERGGPAPEERRAGGEPREPRGGPPREEAAD
ncbi:MAG TPA: aquaporin [Longimicrobiales bacterium]